MGVEKVLGQTNLAVANPHRKSFGKYDCDMAVL